MKLEQEILVNQYGQDLIDLKLLLVTFKNLDTVSKRLFLNDLIYLIIQSKPKNDDGHSAIELSKLKPTYTPCILVKKGVTNQNLQKLIELPDSELEKVFIILMSLFKVAYLRRFNIEKNHPHKWWYWDLSDIEKVEQIMNKI